MNSEFYGSRLPPHIRWVAVEVYFQSGAWFPSMPFNRHRYGLVLTTTNLPGDLWRFDRVAPTTNSGFSAHNYTLFPHYLCYCDIGNLIWEPVWTLNLGGYSHMSTFWELTLPEEVWHAIHTQGLLPGRPV